jgi:hypothetical protein
MTRAISLFDAAKQSTSNKHTGETISMHTQTLDESQQRRCASWLIWSILSHKSARRAHSAAATCRVVRNVLSPAINMRAVCAIVNLVNASLSVDLLARLRPRDVPAALLARLATGTTSEGAGELRGHCGR